MNAVLHCLDLQIACAEAKLEGLREARAAIAAVDARAIAAVVDARPPRVDRDKFAAVVTMEASPNGSPAAPKKLRLPSQRPLGPDVCPPPPVILARQRHVAEYLKLEGPTHAAVLAKALSIPLGTSWQKVIDCDWFEREADGYHLTPKGRQWMEADAPKPTE